MARVDGATIEPLLLIPAKEPELANAKRTQPRPEVPRKLLFIDNELFVTIEPVFVIPVVLSVVLPVAQPRSVLLFIVIAVPVAADRTPTIAPAPVVEVNVPAFERFA